MGKVLNAEAPSSVKTNFLLKCEAFRYGHRIPPEYTCSAENVSPALYWNTPPEETKSFALIMDDPDAPEDVWVHWVIFNIPGRQRSLRRGIPKKVELEEGIKQGLNSWFRLPEKLGYHGPCPPRGTDRYYFNLYALDCMLDLDKPTKSDLMDAMRGHVKGRAEYMGIYTK